MPAMVVCRPRQAGASRGRCGTCGTEEEGERVGEDGEGG